MVKWNGRIFKVLVYYQIVLANFCISLTAHGIDNNFARRNYCLCVTKFEGKHTCEEIAKKLGTLFANWKIPSNKLMAFTTDGASNFRKVYFAYILLENCIILRHSMTSNVTQNILQTRFAQLIH